jgi:hypothetical protein
VGTAYSDSFALIFLSGSASNGAMMHMYDLSSGPRHPEDAATDRHRVKEQDLLEKEMSLARKEQSLREKRHELEAREATLNARFRR